MAEQAISAIVDDCKSPSHGERREERNRYYQETVLAYEGDECLVWPFGKNAYGYGVMQVGGRARIISRLVCEEAHGPPPTSKHHAAHSCGRPVCCNKRHLSWKTPAENKADELVHGTRNRGERNGAVRLTEDQARIILSLKGRISQRKIARRFRVGQTTVRDIHDGKTWGWLFE